MPEQNFIDYVKICCRSGAGGPGSAHFRRDKITSKGGPDGGDGGRGGHIIVRGNKQLWTLLSLKYRKHILGKHGANGSQSGKTGADGEDIILEVPLGTVAKDVETGEILFEISKDKEEKILLAGGRGGLGNTHFKSATNQTPRFAQQGEPGKEEWKILELKVLADVGLVGFPNAGKSTLLSVVTAAKPKIANYPFTTMVPNLGIVSYRDGRSFVMADIPGIIENAHQGKGLGHRFLKHIERNAVLLFMIPIDSDDLNEEFRILLSELEAFNRELLDKPRLVLVTKIDMVDEELLELVKEEIKWEEPTAFISSVSHEGIDSLKDKLWQMLNDD